MEDFYDILKRQRSIAESIRSVETNFKKDSESRKTEEYLKKRIGIIDTLWEEFDQNHAKLLDAPDKSQEYFVDNVYVDVKAIANKTRGMIASYSPQSSPPSSEAVNKDKKVMELFNEQKANFRAMQRVLNNIDINEITEKWEMEDELRNLQTRWNTIDIMHLKIDNLLQGSTGDYESMYLDYEKRYRMAKKALNQKIAANSHLHQSTPQMEIPTFYGDYSQWPTFLDLFKSAIHDNSILSNAQKMQHLKGKLKGEAQRLIQHLNVTAENYLTAWDLLNHRYNNDQLLFTRQIEIFLNQPSIQRQTSSEIKKLHDTTVECVHAIHNLNIDTNSWDPILVHLLTKKLDPVTLSDYKESRKSPRDLASLQEFITFLEHKFTALEPLGKKEREISTPSTSKQQSSFKPRETSFSGPKRTSYYNKPINFNYNNNSHCVLCNANHALYHCKKFETLSPDVKLKTVTKNGMCKNCLYVHERNVCNSNKTCKICHEKHNTLLHEAVNDLTTRQESKATNMPKQQSRSTYACEASSKHITNDNCETLLTTVLIRVRAVDDTWMTLRALLDQGSQITLITENAAQRLGLPRQQLNASVTGVGANMRKSKGKLQLECKSIHDNYTFMTSALIMPKLINNLPNHAFEKTDYTHIKHIQLADPDYNIPKPIDILLDAKVYSEIIMSGLIRGTESQPVAQQTKLGWILSGNVTSTFNCNVVINDIKEIANYWEMEDISTEPSTMTKQEQFCEQLYSSTTRRLPDGRYEVRLPLQEGFENKLGHSKSRAVAQFNQLEDKLTRDCNLNDSYTKFMTEYIELGHMKKCIKKHEPTCYLPHHAVHKADSTTTKLRVVFNASSKTSTGHSLNDLMECGTKLQQDIQDLLIRWRTNQFVYTADCEKMYRCIFIHEDQQHLQKILWRDDPHDLLQEYQLCTVTYGMKAAPFLAMRTMAQLATDDAEKYPLAAKILQNDFYVDDLLSGSNSIEEARDIQHQLINMLKGAGINLRKWSSNTPQLLSDLSPDQINQSSIDIKNVASTKALGLRWSPVTDTFAFVYTDTHPEKSKCSKRKLLSDISKIFDPLGWLSPVTVRAKILFQKVWLAGIDWDTEVPQEIQQEWVKLRDDLHNIDKFQIPRWSGNMTPSIELHGFCDASEKVYACVIYLKSTDDKGNITSRIVASKTKLAPKNKTVTLPRLELCGALLLSQLMAKILRALSQKSIPVYGWTDSLVVLGWLQGNPTRWKTFVANRTTEILQIMPASCWKHISSQNNAADCATRGLTTTQLTSHNLWWEGPPCIKNKISNDVTKIELPEIEIKNQPKTCVVITAPAIIEELLDKYSSLSRIIRIICYVSRFITNLRHRTAARSQTPKREHDTLGIVQDHLMTESYLTACEIDNAYNILSRVVQLQEFQKDVADIKDKGKISSKSHLLGLNPYLDDKNILRVGGRLQHSHLTENAKHPIILPRTSKLTELIIRQAHLQMLHGTAHQTTVAIRQRFWIIGGLRTVKKYINRCVKCARFNARNQSQLMADLPKPRVVPSRPFTHTGIDFTGQVELKANKGRGIKTTRGYIAVFVCFTTKAIHLELVSDLSTPTFLAAFKRMCARRGTPKHVYSDNGTNFVGASRVLKQEHQEILRVINDDFLNDVSEMGLTWHFNAAAWPSGAGVWEISVKSCKHHLKRVLGEQKLTYEEFSTLLAQIEACLNSRPLYALTESPEEDYLTPGHFLIGGPLMSLPITENEEMSSKTRWQLTEKMLHDFWKKWSSDYLQHLQTRRKWNYPTKNLAENDIVLIKDDNLPPAKWALGRVVQTHPGKDGYVRVVTLRSKGKEFQRPIVKLAPLPVQKSEDSDEADASKKSDTAPQRARKHVRGNKPSFLTSVLLLLLTLITPSLQQPFKIDMLKNNNTVYFDKLSDVRIVQEEWKMVVYYNMTTYWNSIDMINNYVHLLNRSCNNDNTCTPVIAQLEHELSEIRHYNDLLTNNHAKRTRRGLINGVGYLANALFGVLDDKFAEKYEKDIETIQKREDHIVNLYKNQTSILEAHNNILKRNELIMTKQLTTLGKTLHNISNDINIAQTTSIRALHTMSIVASLIAADVTISNLRRVQDTLVDTVTDIYHGRLNVHLLPPEQIQQQLNLISGHLQDDTILPSDNIRDLYGLLRIQTRVTKKTLIMEVALPLLNRDQFELDEIISIPQKRENYTVYTTTGTKYIAINLKKDAVIPMTETDLLACMHHTNDQMLCPLNHPIYTLRVGESICDMQLMISNNNKPYCQPVAKKCSDKWIKLHARDAWLFSCCTECPIRMVCPSGVYTKTLIETGIINIPQGCAIKGESFVILTQHDYKSQMYVHQEAYVDTPEISPVNQIMKTSLSADVTIEENHDAEFHDISQKINWMKEQGLEQFTRNDSTHYTIIYSTLTVIVLTIITILLYKLKRRWQPRTIKTDIPLEDVSSAAASTAAKQPEMNRKLHASTSPILTRSISFKDI